MADSLEKEIKKPWKGRFWKGFVLSTVMLAVLLGAPKGVEGRRRGSSVLDHFVNRVLKLERFKGCSGRDCELLYRVGSAGSVNYHKPGVSSPIEKIVSTPSSIEVRDGSDNLIEYYQSTAGNITFYRPNGSVDRTIVSEVGAIVMRDSSGRVIQRLQSTPESLVVYDGGGNLKWSIVSTPSSVDIFDGSGLHVYSVVSYPDRVAMIKTNLTHFDQGQEYYQKAREFEKKSDKINAKVFYQRALNQFTLATKKNPKNGEAWNGLGDAYQALGEYNDAIVAYKKCLRINPKDGNAYCGLGFSYWKSNLKAEAISAWKSGARLGDSCCQQNLEWSKTQ